MTTDKKILAHMHPLGAHSSECRPYARKIRLSGHSRVENTTQHIPTPLLSTTHTEESTNDIHWVKYTAETTLSTTLQTIREKIARM